MQCTIINRTNQFKKNYKRLPVHIQEKFKQKFIVFMKDFFDSQLDTHKLHGKMEGYISSSVNDDFRFITSLDYDKKEVMLINIGNHSIYR